MDDYDRVMSINTKGMLTVSNAAIKVMLTQTNRTFEVPITGATRELSKGVIVNVTSGASLVALPSKVAYVTSKHAAWGLTKSLGMFLPLL